MKLGIILTVHDREHEILMATLRSLRRSGLGAAEVVVVMDRCTMDYSWVEPYLKRAMVADPKVVTTGEYEGFRIGGYGNPARAFNVGLLASTADHVALMSSDVVVTEGAAKGWVRAAESGWVWTPRVINMKDGGEYCGASRFFPMPWMLCAPRRTCLDIGGWDEQYLGGFCYEDNDFVGRLGLAAGTILSDWSRVVWHQDHDQPAYLHDNPEVLDANARNRDLTLHKWGGVPFDPVLTPFDVLRRPHDSGLPSMNFKADGLLEKMVASTKGLVHDRGSVPVQ